MRAEFKFGLGAGLAWLLWVALELALGFHTRHLRAGEIGAWMTEVIQFGMLYLLLRSAHRAMHLGRLEPWDAALKSLIVSAIYAAVVYIGTTAWLTFVDPGWIDRMLNWKVTQMRADHDSEEAIRAFIVATRQSYGPLGLARTCFLMTPLFGAVLGILICIVLNLRWERANLARP